MRVTTHTLKARLQSLLIRPAAVLGLDFNVTARIGFSCSRGQLARASREVDPYDPVTWEYAAFSQNGEDGIIEELLKHVVSPSRYFVEIGASDGLENNTSLLALVHKYSGLMVDGDALKLRMAKRSLQPLNWGVRYMCQIVEPTTVDVVLTQCSHRDPDVFSLDTDGNDYHLMAALLAKGFRPKIAVLEYNSAFGPDQAVTVSYRADFDYASRHASGLYYGASIKAWRRLLEKYGYAFVTVESNGVNAFFVNLSAVSAEFAEMLSAVRGVEFRENYAQAARTGTGWQDQFAQIRALPISIVSNGD